MFAISQACPELGLEVAVAEIDPQLRLLWEQDDARTTASLMNLLVYSEKPGSLLENSVIIQDFTREHACRAILVEIDSSVAVPSIRAWITAHCHLVDGRKSVCCEQISLYLTGKVTGRFRNTVFGHLSSDLPLVFWWQGELSDILTERLLSVVDRLIVDSSSWKDPLDSFRRIVEAVRSNPDLILQDHAWTRTWQFRLGVASVFDDPGARKVLPDLDTVEITHHPDHRNSALQLLAWLAVQAGWKDAEFPGTPAFVSPSGIPIQVFIRENPDGPALSELILRAGEKSAWIRQAAGADHVERRIEAPGNQISSLAPADPTSPEQLLALQLARGGKNSLFQKILPRFRTILEKTVHKGCMPQE
jgi:glucose-6-phosphate dehydrogenase assembly protein OpcA